MSDELLIPFGKYKGQPVLQLRHDPEYLEWLVAQEWFRQRYANINTLIVNNFKEPNETPEHNKLQMRFLDNAFAWKVCIASKLRQLQPFMEWDQLRHNVTQRVIEDVNVEYLDPDENKRIDVSFEHSDGWDVVIRLDWKFGYTRASSRAGLFPGVRNVWQGEHLQRSIYGELKPSIGDEFPRILRECKSRHGYGSSFVLYGEFSGSGATEDQFRAMFARSGISALPLSEVEA